MTKEEFAWRTEQCQGALYRVSCAYLRQECDRLDAVQEALLKAWQGVGGLKEPAYFRTWLIRILIRECVNIQRRQGKITPAADIAPPAPPEEGGHAALREAILALPKGLRVTVVLFYMEGYPVEEIGRILKLPKGTVCSRLSRARKRLKAILEEEKAW